MSCSTPGMKALTEAVYEVALTGLDLNEMAFALRAGYEKGRQEYLRLHPEVGSTSMTSPLSEALEHAADDHIHADAAVARFGKARDRGDARYAGRFHFARGAG